MKRLLGLPKSIYAGAGILILGILFLIFTTNPHPLHVYLLPDQYTGQVVVTFEQEEHPPLEKDGNSYIYRIPESGQLKTSSLVEGGLVEVYYVNAQGERRKVSQERFKGVSVSSGGDALPTRAEFHVGPEE